MSLATANWTTTSVEVLVPGIGTIAEIFGVDLDSITPGSRQELFNLMGSSSEYTKNIPAVEARLAEKGVSIDTLAELVFATRALEGFGRRSVWGPVKATDGQPVTAIITGGTANWMTRRIAELVRIMNQGLKVSQIIVLGGERVCDNDPELTHPAVDAFNVEFGHYPNERELMSLLAKPLGKVHAPKLSGNLEAQMRELLLVESGIVGSSIYVPTNTVNNGLHIRRVIQSMYEDYDSEPTSPDFTFSQDSFALARTKEERSDSANRQNPLSYMSALIRLLDELLRLQGVLNS